MTLCAQALPSSCGGRGRKMKIDVDDMIKSMAGEDPTRLAHWDLIKQHLASMDHTPDHPVYSVMIREAVTVLNDGKGSTREAISQFITERYDVLQGIHSAKLIEQLKKLVEKGEVLITADNCYILPVEHIGSLGELKEGKRMFGRGELGGKGNAYCKVKGGCRKREDLSRTKEVKKQFPVDELESMPAYEVACFANNDNHEAEHANITKEKPQAVIKQTSEEGNFTHMSECFLDEVIDGPPGFCHKIINHQSQFMNEMGDDLQGKQVKVSEEQFPHEESLRKVVEEEVCDPFVERINDQRQMGKCQSLLEENVEAEELIELPGQAPEVVDHQIESSHELDASMPHQALQCLNMKQCAHMDHMLAQEIGRQNNSLEQEQKSSQKEEDANHGTGIRGQPELSMEKDEAMITTPSSSSAELEYGGLLLSIKCLKEANMILLKNYKVMEEMLRENMNCLSLLEASFFSLPQPMAGEHMMVPQSKTTPLSHSEFVSRDKVQYLLNQESEVSSLKRAGELLKKTSDEAAYQSKLLKTWHLKWGHNFGSSSVQVDLKQLEVENPRDQSKFESCEKLCDRQKPGESCLRVPSPEAAFDLQRLDLVQQTDQCVDTDHTRQEQPLCLTKTGMASEKSASILEQEQTAVADISTVMHQVEHDGLQGGQPETDSSFHSRSLVEDGSAGHEKMDEQLPSEQLKQGDQHEMALQEGLVDCEMTTADKSCPTELQIQGNMFLPLEQITSTFVQGPTPCTGNGQPENVEVSEEETQRIVGASSKGLEKQEKSSNLEFQPKREWPIRQLRPRKAKPSESDESRIAVCNNLDLVLSTLKSEKNKPGPSGQVKPARVEDLSENQQQKQQQWESFPVVVDIKELIYLQNEQEQQDKPQHQGQSGPADVGCATPDVTEKDMPNHQTQFTTLRKKCGRGRPRKIRDSSDENVNSFSQHHHSMGLVLQSPSKTKPPSDMAVTGVKSSTYEQQPQKSMEGRITRSREAAIEASAVLALPSPRQHATLWSHRKEKVSKRKIDSMDNLLLPEQVQQLLKCKRPRKN